MKTKLTKLLKVLIDYSLYLFVFLLPWQTKLILRSDGNNFNEISLSLSYIVLLFLLIFFVIYELRTKGLRDQKCRWCRFLIGVEIFSLVSVFIAKDLDLALFHYAILLSSFGLIYILRKTIQTRESDDTGLNMLKLTYVFLTSIFIDSLLAIYQFLSQSSFASTVLGMAQHSADTLGVAVIETSSGRWLRSYGSFDHPNILGGVLAISLIIIAFLLTRKYLRASKRKMMLFLYLFVVYFVSLFALFFSFSRAAWLAYIIGIIILLFSSIIKKDKWVIKRLLVLMIFSVILISTAISPYYNLVKTRIQAQGRLETKSLQERELGYHQAKHILQKHLLFGVGLGNYVQTLRREDNDKQAVWSYAPVHNALLLFLIETGPLSFLFLIGFLFYLIIKNHSKDYAWAIIGALFVLLFLDHWLISLPLGLLFFFFVLGLI